jgi:hypothetical protein
MTPHDDNPSTDPKRLRLRSTFGHQSAPLEPSSAEPDNSAATTSRLKLNPRENTRPTTPPSEAHSQKKSSPPGVPAAGPEPSSPEDASASPRGHKTSPVYYALLVAALIGSGIILFRDKSGSQNSAPLPAPMESRVAEPTLESPLSPPAALVQETGKTDTDLFGNAKSVSDYIEALQAARPERTQEPEGILVRGILFEVGSTLSTDPVVQLSAIEDSLDGPFALLTVEGQSIPLRLR